MDLKSRKMIQSQIQIFEYDNYVLHHPEQTFRFTEICSEERNMVEYTVTQFIQLKKIWMTPNSAQKYKYKRRVERHSSPT